MTTNAQLAELIEAIEEGAELTSKRTVAPDQLHVVTVMIPGITAADALDANDAVGSMFSIDVPKIGILESFKLIDPDDDTLALTAHIFSAPFATPIANDAAFTVLFQEGRNWITSVLFDVILDLGGVKVAEEVGTSYYEAPTGKLYVQCSTTGTPNIAAGKMPILVIGIRAGVKA